MKKLLAISVLLNLALVVGLGLSWKVLTAHAAGGGGGVPAGNGDVNGDGTIDISDAVYLLSSLFTGGPAPVAIVCPPPTVKGLPATGQTETDNDCLGQRGGEDGCYKAGCPSEGRFVDNGDGTVTDNCTGLIWRKDTADVNGDGNINDADQVSWYDALALCEGLEFAGHNDWRLPNVRELESIIDYGRLDPAIDPVFGVASGWYWSSTSDFEPICGVGCSRSRWIVRFAYLGEVGLSPVRSANPIVGSVRAVRNGA